MFTILDFEFNQAFSMNNCKDMVNPKCRFEIIQIGAVKVDDNYDIIDEFNILIKPNIYPTIHPFVEKITGFKYKPYFPEAFKKFRRFLGDDTVLGTWGYSDIRALFRNLTYYNNRGKDLKKYMEEIDYLRKQINLCKDVPELMGIEGNIRKVYYDSWNIIINQDIAFEKRVKNPPDNAINSLISYVNTIIYTRVLSEIYKTQLNPTISYLHEPSERRFSLCLDIAEIFKPIIADRLIFSMLNKRQITEKDFEEGLNFTYIKDSARKDITREIDLRLQTKIKHKKLDREVSYEYLMRLEVYKLIKHLLEDEEYEGFKMWW